MATNSLQFSGELSAKVIRAKKAPLSWRLRNTFRVGNILGLIETYAARTFSATFGIPTITGELRATKIFASGERVNYGTVSRRKVTQAAVAFLVDDWDAGTTEIANMNYHASGTTNTAESNADTALVAEATTITDRATGTKSQPAANQLQSLATQAFTGTGTIVEHGIFSVVTESTGTLWDRSVFTGIPVASGDSIQWTYICTVNYEA